MGHIFNIFASMKSNFTLAIQAAVKAGKEILEIYGREDFEVETKEDDSPLTLADKRAHGIITEMLKDKNVDPSYNNNHAIRGASENGYVELVKLLLSDSRVDPSTVDNWAIQEASRYGYEQVGELLLRDEREDP